ncbi:hypothetical protein IH992_29860 [Candidatus Poribacteria bacterium]|nr:hypothetical protein [Candidatus Poribacteria bacterium]
MPVRSYRDLDIYTLSYNLALEVDFMTRSLPRYEFALKVVRFGVLLKEFQRILPSDMVVNVIV